jgi:predicted nucleic acid-binding protein
VALEDVGDSRHQEARLFWDRVGSSKTTFRQFYTSDYIVDEVLTLLARRVSKEVAVNTWHHMKDSRLLGVLRVTEEIEADAFEIFQGGPDDLSFTDSTSFALMRGEAIGSAFAFDDHFRQYGFRVFP